MKHASTDNVLAIDYRWLMGDTVHWGVLVIKPDFPEEKTDWPFLWFENEATVATTASYILTANAVIAETSSK